MTSLLRLRITLFLATAQQPKLCKSSNEHVTDIAILPFIPNYTRPSNTRLRRPAPADRSAPCGESLPDGSFDQGHLVDLYCQFPGLIYKGAFLAASQFLSPRILHITLRSLYELVVDDKREKLLSDKGIAFNCVVTVVDEVFMGPWNL